jgi:FtsP/CotA-like multicopper oxidase with cupredoxin domain
MVRIPRSFAFTAIACAFLFTGGSLTSRGGAQDLPAARDLSVRPAFAEPVVLGTKDGTLEVTLTAHQGHAQLDTVASPVKNMLVFGYTVERGTASDGNMSGDNIYPAPTLQVYPGQTLIVHFNNGLSGLTIGDYYNPAYTPKGQTVPLYPSPMKTSPVNLHVHGVHVSPKGNADNVLLDIEPGMSNTYVYHVPTDMPQGAYWYHSHLHTVTASQTYYGLAGLLAIGRVDGNLPIVSAKHLPIRNFILQYNDVFDRAGGMSQMINPNWPQYVSTLKAPTGTQLADGTYQPSLAPVNFTQAPKGTKYFTVWWAGPLAIENNRGLFQFVPANLQRFTPAKGGRASDNIPADAALPDYKRDIQFTVNGQFEPALKVKPGQTEIWVLENITDFAYENVQLTETATGRHPKIAIVGQDGNPYLNVHYPLERNGTELLLSPATRYAIAVTMPATGDLVLSLPALGRGGKTKTAPAVLYTNDGTRKTPAALGSVSVLPSAISYADGFFIFPTQELARAVPDEGQGESTAFVEGQPLHAYTSFHDVSKVKPDVTRTLLINGGFLNDKASPNDPKAFVYAFDGQAFPNIPLIQPRLGSVEEWKFVNENNDEHPIHVHVNDFQVTHYHDPTTGLTSGPQMWGADNVNVPAPTMGAHEAVVTPGSLSMRTKFLDFIGLYVLHCHRLNHEDNGLMALINVIPAVSSYAVAVPGSPGHAATVKVYDGNGDRLIATVTPFPGFYGTPNVAMGDVEGYGVLDLIVGAGAGARPDVVVYSGKGAAGVGPFHREVARFTAFDAKARGGVSVASAQIDGTTHDNIIAGSGAGITDRVNVYSTELPALGTPPALFSSFTPYRNDRSGVSVATGVVDLMSGRYSIVTAPGPGPESLLEVFRYSLMSHIGTVDAAAPQPDRTATFAPFGSAYRGGISLGVGWIAGSQGGAQSIVAGQVNGGAVKVYTSGNALQGAPMLYLMNPEMHDRDIMFTQVANFSPFGTVNGVHVGTTATTMGADLLVSGSLAGSGAAQVVKYDLVRAAPKDTTLTPKRLDVVSSTTGAKPGPIAGN